jgi:leader peptidase (prepilin peptidase)/N-methyltransferase
VCFDPQRYAGRVLLAEFPQSWLVGMSITLGLLFGSFLNVVVHRLPRGQGVAFPPSTCPNCGERIKPFDNIPVVSWLWLRGKARCCGAAISPRYPMVEATGGVIGWGVMQALILRLPGNTPLWEALTHFALFFALSLGLLAALFIDLEHMILPDEITLGGAALGLASVPLRDIQWSEALVGGAFGFAVVWLPFDVGYRALRGHPGMGLGDAKLLMLAGVWFGWVGALFALLAGAIQGTVFALGVFAARGRIDEPEAVTQEREALHRELAELSTEERRQALEDLGDDVLSREPEEGLAGARLAFGPFLILSLFEFLFFRAELEQVFFEVFWLA